MWDPRAPASLHQNLQAGLAQRCSLGGRERGPPTPGGERLAFRLAQAGRGKVCHITVESSHLLTKPVMVWGGFRAKRAGERGRGMQGHFWRAPLRARGGGNTSPPPWGQTRPSPGCWCAPDTGCPVTLLSQQGPPPGAKIAQAISSDSNQHLCLQEPELP